MRLCSVSDGHNVAIGHGVMAGGTGGYYNICIGKDTGAAFADANVGTCVLIGHEAGDAINNSGADSTIAIGYQALSALQSGSGNVAIGYEALNDLTTGARNLAIGQQAADKLTVGDDNIAIGKGAMGALSTTDVSDRNIAIGSYAMDDVSTLAAQDNIFIGHDAGGGSWTTTLSKRNVGIGSYVMDGALQGADYNTGVGYGALGALTQGISNTCFGYNSGGAINTGNYNTCLGTNAGSTITSGSSNTLIGSGAAVADADTTDNIVLGVDTQAHADGTYMSIGRGTGTDRWWIDYGTSTTWARESDERLKKNIENSTLGLDFVNDLRAVKYQWRTGEEQPEEVQRYSKAGELESPLDTETINYGMIAQEVKSALDTVGVDDFPGWSEDRDGIQALSVSSFVLPLIKAVQELSAKVEALEDAQ